MRFLLVFLILCFPVVARAQTGSAQTTAALNAEVNSLFADNTSGQITPFSARQTLLDIIASAGIFTGTANTWTAAQAFSGGATAPTQSNGNNTTNVATTAFIQNFLGVAHTWTATQTISSAAGIVQGSPFIQPPNFGGSNTALGFQGVLGIVGTPTTNADPPFIFEKTANVTNNVQNNSTMLVTAFQNNNGATSWMSAFTAIIVDNAGQSSSSNSLHYLESGRFISAIPAGIFNGNPGGVVSASVVNAGATFATGVIPFEGQTFVQLGGAGDAPVPASANVNHWIVPYLASNTGSSKADAGFATNPFNVTTFRVGFYVAAASVDQVAFYNAASLVNAIDISTGTYSGPQVLGKGWSVGGAGGSINSFPAAGASSLVLNPQAATQQATIGFQQTSSTLWQMGKDTNNSFFLFDVVRTASDITIPSNGDMTLMGTSGNVVVGTASTGNLTVGGTLRFNTALSANGSAGLTTVCTVTAGNTLTFTLGTLTGKGANCT